MLYLARKINRAKWNTENTYLALSEIPADALSGDLRTSGNALSFWIVQDASEERLHETALALITAAERIDTMDLAWIDEHSVRAQAIVITMQDGNTPVTSLRQKHVDIERLDMSRLCVIASLIAEALTQTQYRRFSRKELTQIIVNAVRNNLVSLNDLKQKVREEVEMALNNG